MQVNDIDLSADFDDYDAEPIDTQLIPESENGMDWDEFSA